MEKKVGITSVSSVRRPFYGNYEHYNTGGIIGGNSFTATGRPRDLKTSSIPEPFISRVGC